MACSRIYLFSSVPIFGLIHCVGLFVEKCDGMHNVTRESRDNCGAIHPLICGEYELKRQTLLYEIVIEFQSDAYGWLRMG